ncbi:hypothetical protein SPRG_14898 [Saprolegnia parasitica CBS 223.65]|uniref:Uncharacterized protein n=1 Tax=Saprolegnia parasitica (strain CBS 223.65) TaxID=695850 RepID=A0A067BNQ0_SAPPC|nr:hypothetical protein SPRG_14898 [Saprolegnia parasitica CBS 223.65]KDO19868.1 hypothetical protein SPRG_14898 [Saprolegnia parasitica CBS 223.65]|eukprot:XP_012209425.1 hypothetical protein SPRG_14898 [Saprolegnia parasitica CBS 223.65]
MRVRHVWELPTFYYYAVVVNRVASLQEEEESKAHAPESGTGRYGQRPSYAAAVNGVKQRAAQALRHTFVRLLPEPAALREIIERNTTMFASFTPQEEALAGPARGRESARVPQGDEEFADYSNHEITDEFFSVINSDVWMINKTNDGSLVFSTMDHETLSEMLNKSVELFGETYTFTASADQERAALEPNGHFRGHWLDRQVRLDEGQALVEARVDRLVTFDELADRRGLGQ